MIALRLSPISLIGLLIAIAAAPASATDRVWEAKVAKLVSANFSYPRSAEIRREEGRAVVRLLILPSGKPTSIELAQSSGSQILDREALRITAKIGDFPPPPNGASATILVPISWRLGDRK